MLGVAIDNQNLLGPIRVYLDDVDQDAVDLHTLSVSVKDNLGRSHVFIREPERTVHP